MRGPGYRAPPATIQGDTSVSTYRCRRPVRTHDVGPVRSTDYHARASATRGPAVRLGRVCPRPSHHDQCIVSLSDGQIATATVRPLQSTRFQLAQPWMRVAPIALNALSPRLSTHALAFASSASHPSATRPLKRRRLATAASTMAPTPSSPRMQSGALGPPTRPVGASIDGTRLRTKLPATALSDEPSRPETVHHGCDCANATLARR